MDGKNIPKLARSPLSDLWILGVVSTLFYVFILYLSHSFIFGEGHADRPLLQVLLLFVGASACYLAALFFVVKIHRPQATTPQFSTKNVLRVILFFAVVFRVLMLFSAPIQEIDFYRYMWDGRVFAAGGNPFEFAPQQVEQWRHGGEHSAERQRLWEVSQQSPAVQTIFKRVHHRHIPTVYPPAAQVVFAIAAAVTPVQASLPVHVLIMKFLLLLFDIGTVLVLIQILRILDKPASWCLAYAWCPLVMKEIANSAHLDSIAVFFTVLCVFLLLCHCKQAKNLSANLLMGLGSAATGCLALGVLAKSYPIILLPVVVGFLLAKLKQRVVIPAAVFGLMILIGYLPFVSLSRQTQPKIAAAPAHDNQTQTASNTPFKGLKTFLTHWQMNDFLFVIVHENLRRPVKEVERFFVITPRGLRQGIHNAGVATLEQLPLQLPKNDPAFLLTAALMGTIIVGLSLFWAVKLFRNPDPLLLVRGVFLVLIWGWLLSAAQNPWYLVWSLPFMVFEGRRSWFLLPLVVFTYYLRFWLEYSVWPDMTKVLWYRELFDYSLIWLEYLPFFILLIAETLYLRRKNDAPAKTTTTNDKPKPNTKRKKKRGKKAATTAAQSAKRRLAS